MTSLSAPPLDPEPARIVRVAGRDSADPEMPWELPATPADLDELSTRRFERLPHRPANPGEVPDEALDALRDRLGPLTLEQLFVIPRSARMAGAEAAHWVVAPTEVLAVTPERIAVWLDAADGPRIRAEAATSDVIAILDRTVLLHGRLELVCREGSIVLRYNTVGRPDVRSLLHAVRAAGWTIPGAGPVPPLPAGRDPGTLPHKWMALVRSSDVQPGGPRPAAVAAGDLERDGLLHAGVAVLTADELVVATDPTPDPTMAQYGFDLHVIARARARALGGSGSTLRVTVDADPGLVEVHVGAHPSLVEAAVRTLGPLLGPARAG